MTAHDPTPRYRMGVAAFRAGKTWQGGHAAPCTIKWCKRDECRGFKAAMKMDQQRVERDARTRTPATPSAWPNPFEREGTF